MQDRAKDLINRMFSLPMKRIAIITEGGVAIGLGHVQRMLTLAGTLNRNAKIIFITTSGTEVQIKIEGAGYELVRTSLDYRQALESLLPLDTVIIDKLDVDDVIASWVRQETEARLVIFGNVSSANQHAHIVVNAIIGTRFQNRRYRNRATGTLYLEGPRYVMLGDAFRAQKDAYSYRGILERILLIFGGSDQANLTCRATRQLRKLNTTLAITACVGAAYPHSSELAALAMDEEQAPRNFLIVKNTTAVAQLMLGADFILTSPGNSLFEAISLGVPAIAFYQTESQAEMFRGFPCCYELDTFDGINALVENIYSDYQQYRSLINLLDLGQGYGEIIDALAA